MVRAAAPRARRTCKAHRANIYAAGMGHLRGSFMGIHVRCQKLTLRIYSPAHAVWWAVSGSLGMQVWTSWLVTLVLMFLFSAQSFILAREYAAHVKDRQVLSSEVLREYDEKFVMPRAMPLVRDASTMTDE